MSELRPSPTTTHEVINQPELLTGYNLLSTDPTVTAFLKRSRASTEELGDLGQWLGTPEAIELGRQANAYPPVLRSYDSRGNRIDEVEFHPSYHRLMSTTIGAGIASFPEQERPDPNHHLKRAVGMYLISQNEAGHGCPISMTYAAVPSLRHNPELSATYEPLLRAHFYAPELVPARSKGSATAGMAMTEKQGGSDLRANTTVADLGGSGEALLTGHKWFCSAPMSDLFLTLARDKDGLSCYLVPRVLEDGTRNSVIVRRLKDKLGNRSNASSEIEYDHTVGYRVGEPGRGVKTIMDMVAFCRYDSMLGSAAQMRQGLVQAIWFARGRSVFGKSLIEQELMQNVLVDLAIESEAATITSLYLANADDRSSTDPVARSFRRIAVAASKFLICKRAPAFMAEAMESLGGNGYVEESILARLFRESPLNGIWEGSGNVNALDVLRAMAKEPASVAALLAELEGNAGSNAAYDSALAAFKHELTHLESPEWQARELVEKMALLIESSLMLRYSAATNAQLFCDSRLGGRHGSVLGTLPRTGEAKSILEAAFPHF
jgi:putative acyl-CoA dehydrogenase